MANILLDGASKSKSTVSVKLNLERKLSCEFDARSITKSIAGKKTINARTVLWYMAFLGFIINYMFRININIAIVEMVESVQKPKVNSSECHTLSTPSIPDSLKNSSKYDVNVMNVSIVKLFFFVIHPIICFCIFDI